MIKMKFSIRFIAFLLSITSTTLQADTIAGSVIGISDGDTLTILDSSKIEHKVRLAAIDAPEKSQPFGQKSKQVMLDLCYRKQASVVIIDVDRYGRSVGEVTCSGVYANEAMLRQGMAWVYRKYAKGYGHFYKVEDEAKSSRRGLWSDASPVAPWEWRKAKRLRNSHPSDKHI